MLNYHQFHAHKDLIAFDGISMIPELNEQGELDFYGSEFIHTLTVEDIVKLRDTLTMILENKDVEKTNF